MPDQFTQGFVNLDLEALGLFQRNYARQAHDLVPLEVALSDIFERAY
jgi:hypothetical protein